MKPKATAAVRWPKVERVVCDVAREYLFLSGRKFWSALGVNTQQPNLIKKNE